MEHELRTRAAGVPIVFGRGRRPRSTGRRARRARLVCVAIAALLGVLSTAVVSSSVAAQQADDSVRIVARKLSSGRVEFGLQQHRSDDTWSSTRLPAQRFFPPTAGIGRWLRSSPLTVRVAAAGSTSASAVVVRIVARKLADGRVEFGLQSRQSDDSWSGRLLPRVRFFPTGARVGRWLRSSPISVISTRPAGASDFAAVSAGLEHSCGLRASGAVTCWGSEEFGQADAPEGTFRAVAAGGLHSCGLRTGGSIVCWGANDDGQRFAPDGTFSAVTAGLGHSCAVSTSGAVTCWGLDNFAQADAPDGAFRAVAAGGFHSCGLRTSGAITCWGANEDGQTDAPDGAFRAVAAGGFHSCGLSTSGAITCWGGNEDGQTDVPDGNFRAVTAGARHSCGLRTSGTVTCWGRDIFAQAYAPDGAFAAITAGRSHSCALQASGRVVCWGSNRSGQTDVPAT